MKSLRQANSPAVSQEITGNLWDLKVHYHVHYMTVYSDWKAEFVYS
jgi:hypothetical protein